MTLWHLEQTTSRHKKSEGRSCNQVIDLIRLSWWNSSVLTQIMMIKSRSRRKRVQLNTSAISMELFHSIQLTKCFPGSLCSNFTRFSQVFILYKSLIIILPRNFNSFNWIFFLYKGLHFTFYFKFFSCAWIVWLRDLNTFTIKNVHWDWDTCIEHWSGAYFNFPSACLNQSSICLKINFCCKLLSETLPSAGSNTLSTRCIQTLATKSCKGV